LAPITNVTGTEVHFLGNYFILKLFVTGECGLKENIMSAYALRRKFELFICIVEGSNAIISYAAYPPSRPPELECR
jgi:hypothetical protein